MQIGYKISRSLIQGMSVKEGYYKIKIGMKLEITKGLTDVKMVWWMISRKAITNI